MMAAVGDPRMLSVVELDTFFHVLVERARPAVFVEAGAYEAATSVRVAEAVPGCRVVAFEANPYVYQRFTRSTDFAARGVEYRHQALADRQGDVSFFVVSDSSSWCDDRVEGYNSLLKRSGGDWLGEVGYEEVTVSATTLDSEFSSADGPFAMWMDVEGAARTVLAGAAGFLRRCEVLKIEVEDRPFWQQQWLADDVVAELARHGLLPIARDAESQQQYNMLFARQD